MVGYKTVAGGSSDPECTHVILTLDEYDELHQRIRAAINDGKRAKEDAARAAATSAENAEKAVKKIQADAAQEIAQLQNKVETERAGKEYQIGLNQDFKRIARERANADRGVKPKKERSGYVVLSSRQKKYRYKENRHEMAEVYLWETVIQTPYVVSFTAEQVMTETQELFERDEQGHWLIGRLGIADVYSGKYEEMLVDKQCATWKDYNIIVEKIFNANVKVGYWEIIITHTKPLDNIGTELL
ncbi:MAG: hypothetical protein ACI3XQ_12625 [Eubacteriales bacterium]